jgi:hypothetical protein
MNDRQFFALMNPARTLAASTETADYQDVVRTKSGALVRNWLTVDVVKGRPAWHSFVAVLDPRTRAIAPLAALPLRLHAELKTMAAKLLIGVGEDPSDLHPKNLGWHCYRLCTVLEMARIPEPDPVLESPKPLALGEPLIVREGETIVPDDETGGV